MSLREYEDFVYRACHVTGEDDPEAHWRNVAAELTARAAQMDGVRELRVVGPDTDLRLVVEGRIWRPAGGERNMPDGEVFTSPVEDGTEGEIRFTFPAVFANREVEDVRLRFEGGRVVQAEATRGADYLRALLDMDADARGSASSPSASTTRSTGSHATSSSTRRSAGPCTSRSAPGSRISAGGTAPACTGI